MLFGLLTDPEPLAEADLDTPDMVETAAVLTLCEQHLRMLTRMAELGMEMLEVISQNANKAPDDVKAAADAFTKISQAVRRTIALHDKLARDVKSDRGSLQARRARRREDAAEAYRKAKDETIIGGVADALAVSFPDAADDDADIERLLRDVEESLSDPDELGGYLDRPVGETVAKLCADLGLDPDICLFDGDVWKVRRIISEFEERREAFARKAREPASNPLSVPAPLREARAPP